MLQASNIQYNIAHTSIVLGQSGLVYCERFHTGCIQVVSEAFVDDGKLEKNLAP